MGSPAREAAEGHSFQHQRPCGDFGDALLQADRIVTGLTFEVFDRVGARDV